MSVLLSTAVVSPGRGVRASEEGNGHAAICGQAGVGRGAAVVGGDIRSGARRRGPVDVHVPTGDLLPVLVPNRWVGH